MTSSDGLKSAVSCKNCKHQIVKRKGVWKHRRGGTYCHIIKDGIAKGSTSSWSGCGCHKAEPSEEHNAKSN